jgi:hypothetical protein
MSQITTKWIADGAITPVKLDSSGSFTVKDLHVTRDATVTGDLLVTGNATIAGAFIFNDATVDNLDVLNQLNANLITGTDSTYTATNNNNVWALNSLSLYGNIDATLASSGDVHIISGDSADASCLGLFNVQAQDINLLATGDSTFTANINNVWALNSLSLYGSNDTTLASSGDVHIIAGDSADTSCLGLFNVQAQDINLFATGDSTFTATNINNVWALNSLSLYGSNDTTLASAGDVHIIAGDSVDASCLGLFNVQAQDINLLATGDSTFTATNINNVWALNSLSLYGSNDTTLASAGDIHIIAGDSADTSCLGPFNVQAQDINLSSDNDSSHTTAGNLAMVSSGAIAVTSSGNMDTTATSGSMGLHTVVGVIKINGYSGLDLQSGGMGPLNVTTPSTINVVSGNAINIVSGADATIGLSDSGNIALTNNYAGAGIDANCKGPINVTAYDGSDAFQLTGTAGDLVLKNTGGVYQIISETSPLEIKTLGSQDMTVWPQGNLKLWTPGGAMVLQPSTVVDVTCSGSENRLSLGPFIRADGGTSSLLTITVDTTTSAVFHTDRIAALKTVELSSTGWNSLRFMTFYTPSGTADSSGSVGSMAVDDNYIYAKGSGGWKRATLNTF